MLALTTHLGVHLLGPAVFKACPEFIPSGEELSEAPTATAWTTGALFVASRASITRFDALGQIISTYTPPESSEDIASIVGKDGAAFYARGNEISLLDSQGHSTGAFQTHTSDVTSLSVSNDTTLLASTSSAAVHVHNLALNSHTVLRGLPAAGVITACAFHPHSRTRLLLAAGSQLIVYDTARPSGPAKTIQMNEATGIIGVACSPFSKTLVAVASSGGTVGLVDLDKEKALFRTLNLKTTLTSVTFSYEGAAIYLGTEDGRLLIMDLRALDKPPKVMKVGSPVVSMAVQKKLKPSPEGTTKSTGTASDPARRASAPSKAAPARAPRTTAPAPSPRKAPAVRVVRAAKPSIVSSPCRPTVRAGVKSTPKGVATKPIITAGLKETKVLSPVLLNEVEGLKEDLNFSINVESLAPMRGTRGQPARIGSSTSAARVTSSASSATRVASSSRTVSSASSARLSTSDSPPPPERPSALRRRDREESASIRSTRTEKKGEPPSSRARTISSTSRTDTESASVKSRRAEPTSRASSSRQGTSASARSRAASRTPSPDLPSMDPITPLPIGKTKRSVDSVLGMGTPEVDRWIQAGEGKGMGKATTGKVVGFASECEDEDDGERSLVVHTTPHRATTGASWLPSPHHQQKQQPQHDVSPVRPPPPEGTGAHDLLRNIVKDVMYDMERDRKADMTGLHLDLVRMGRGWKKELKDLMEEYVGDLNDLREENRVLREENERLRRGY